MNAIKCDECQQHLFSFADNQLNQDLRQVVETHLHSCNDCQGALSSIWQMQNAATRWQDEHLPARHSLRSPFEPQTSGWLGTFGLQWATSLASVVVLVLVLMETRVSTVDGLTIEFGTDKEYVSTADLDSRLNTLQQSQATQLTASLNELNDRQVTTNQLLLRTLLQTSRQERHEDLQNVLALMESVQAERAVSTEESLRFLIASQRRDREEIRELNNALLQVNNRNY